MPRDTSVSVMAIARQIVTLDKWHCYIVVHPVSRIPVYVGVTADLHSRVVAHKSNGPVRDFFQQNGWEGLEPEIVVLKEFDKKGDALDFEVDMISKIDGLLNISFHRMPDSFERPLASKRHLTIEAQQPWVALGMSRRTWYRRRKSG